MSRSFAERGLSINYGPEKSCYMQTSRADKRYDAEIGKLEKVERYQYLGALLTTDKRGLINYKGLTKAQSTNRNQQARQVAGKFARMLRNK